MNTEQQRAYEWAKNQNYTSVAAQYAKLLAEVIESLQEDNTAMKLEWQEAHGELRQLRERLGAAVEDMRAMALSMRESEELSEGRCFACIYDAQNLPDNVILAYGECPGYETDDCFEWRDHKKSGEDMAEQKNAVEMTEE